MILSAVATEPGMAPQRFRATGNDFTVGRGADCDWTLPDPTRQLSKRHCRLSSTNGQWRITDLSSNGMTVNDQTVTPGVSHPVQTGDRLGMGTYIITLSVDGAFDGPPLLRDEADASPFGDGRQGGRLVGDPFVSPTAQLITDPFDVALPPLFEERDEPPARPQTSGSVGDDVSALHEPFEPPRPGNLLLPVDWDEPLQAETGRSTADEPLSPTIDRPLPDDRPSVQDRSPFGEDASPVAIPVPSSGRGEGAPPGEPVSVASSEAGTVQTSRPDPGQTDAALRAFAAFARGAGLEGTPQDAPEEALEKLGRAFRAYVVGLRRLLIARATVKGEFRIDRTMIRPFGNNPIKFATDDNDALCALLGIGRQVGMTAEQAVADSIRDVRSHELALNEAFQHGIREVVAELSPGQVATEMQPGAFDAIPVLRDGRRWRFFENRHAKLQASLENSLDSVFGQAFARGYEAALQKLSEAEDAPPPGRAS